MAPQLIYIEQFQRGRCDKKFVIRVSRIWSYYNTRKDRDLMSVDFVAIDENDHAIQCTIRSRFIPDFQGLFVEGSFYSIKNFSVEVRKLEFRVIQRGHYLLMDASTFVEEIVRNPPKIPRHFFQIVPFNMLLETSDNKKIYVANIIGYVVGASDVVQRMSNFKPVSMQYIDLKDVRGLKFRITLWGDVVINKAAVIPTSNQRVWIITSTIVKLESSGSLGISSSSATHLYNDDSIVEIKEFISMYNAYEEESEIGKITIASSYVSKDDYQQNKKLMQEIKDMLFRNEKLVNMGYSFSNKKARRVLNF